MRKLLLLLAGVAVTLSGSATGASHPESTMACRGKLLRLPSIKFASLNGLAVRSPNDVWIVGSRGRLERERTLAVHYDGRSVRVVPTPNPFSAFDQLSGVATVGGDDVWAVGEGAMRTNRNRSAPLVLRFDGAGWRSVSVPGPSVGFGSSLDAVDGAAADDVWTVGTARPDVKGSVGLIEHWDGREWQIVPSPTPMYSTVTAISENDVWAAGGGDWVNPDNGPTVHWDGRSWKPVRDNGGPNRETEGIDSSASGPNDLWIVGMDAARPFAERSDGRRFTRVPVPHTHWRARYTHREDSYLSGVAAISPGDVWAVGDFGIEHYDGRRWQLRSRDPDYIDTSAATASDVWAVGGAKILHIICR